MANNTAKAREQLEGHRRAVREHARKWRDYSAHQDKNFALKTIENAQRHIQRLKDAHPSLSSNQREDSWRSGDAVPW